MVDLMGLFEQMLARREQWVTVDGLEFQIRRPTAWQLANDLKSPIDKVRLCVIGWKVRENQLIGSAGGGAIPTFDSAVLVEFASDRPKLMVGLIEAIDKMVQDYWTNQQDTEKN